MAAHYRHGGTTKSGPGYFRTVEVKLPVAKYLTTHILHPHREIAGLLRIIGAPNIKQLENSSEPEGYEDKYCFSPQ